jgi:hypothetical protein
VYAYLLDSLAGLDCIPYLIRDDAQVRSFDDLPLLGLVWARNALTRLRVFDHGYAIKYQEADIGLVVEQAAMALEIAIDCRGSPMLSKSSRNAIAIQPSRNGARRVARGIFVKDPRRTTLA